MINEYLRTFIESHFCSYTDIHTEFPFSSSSEFGILLSYIESGANINEKNIIVKTPLNTC